MPVILPRYGYGYSNDCYEDAYGNTSCYQSAWSRWVRWLVLGLIILGALTLFFLCSCLTARRRRKAGMEPYRGTGWALGRTPPGHGAATYNGTTQPPFQSENQQSQPYYNNSNNPPPAYAPPANNDNQGYYGQEHELQPPSAAYNGAYAPPKGPPPAHPHDGIIR